MENKKEIIELLDEYIDYKKKMENASQKLDKYLPYGICDCTTRGHILMLENKFNILAELMDLPVLEEKGYKYTIKYFMYKDIKIYAMLNVVV